MTSEKQGTREKGVRWVSPPSTDWRNDVDAVIGYALLETEHIPGFANRGPAFREKLAEAGWEIQKVPA